MSRRLRPTGWSALLAAAWLVAGPTGGAGALPQPARASMLVIVTGREDERARAGLTAAEFEVTVDGRATAIVSVTPVAEPFSLVVLTDISGTTFLEKADNAFSRAIADEIVAKLAAGDRVLLGTFARAGHFQRGFSADVTTLRAENLRLFELVEAERQGPSPVWDSLDEAVSLVENEAGQRAIVLVTDGMASGNRLAAADVHRRAASAGVPVFVLAEGGDAHVATLARASGQRVTTAADNLRLAAETTGGLYFTDGLVDSWNRPRPKPFLAAILDALRARYRVEFELPAGGAAGPIEIGLRDASLRAHYARRRR